MKKNCIIFMFFYFLLSHNVTFGQDEVTSKWQEQILNHIDAETMSETQYLRLLEMLSDLEVSRNDSVRHRRITQDIVLSGKRNPPNSDYLGDEWAEVLRYKMNVSDRWSMGLTLHNDAGEVFHHELPLFDNYSYFMQYKRRNRKIILGDYRVRFGSGLLLNQQFSLGKNMQNIEFRNMGTSVSPHASTDEYNYMQGIAADLRIGRVRLMPFVSMKLIDASIKDGEMTSIKTDGYHRTQKEEQKRNQANVVNAGLHLGMRGDWYEVGANVLYTRFSLPYNRPVRTYNIYYYRGQDLLQGSVEYHLQRYGFELRGETAFDQKLNIASIGQLAHHLGEDWNASLLYRYYSDCYQQLYASAITESTNYQGEQGYMLMIDGEPLPHLSVALMADYFRFSTVQYGFDSPIDGLDLRSQLQYSRKRWDAKLRYKMRLKEDIHHSFDAETSVALTGGLSLRTQLHGKIFSSKKKGGYQTGYAVSEALIWKQDSSPLRAELQGAWYDAGDYQTRLYISESNILYGYSIPMLYGKGWRMSMMASYKIKPCITLDLKGSLQDEKYNLWVQLRLKLL